MTLTEILALGARLGATTHGVVAAAELRLAGADPDAVKAALGKHWQRPVSGIYVVDDRPLTDVVKAHVAVKHAGHGAVVTGLFAARWLSLRWVPPSTQVHVLIDTRRRRRGSEGFVLVRRFHDVARLPTWTYENLRVAPVPQVVVDAARELSELRDVRGLVLGAIADDRCTVAQVRAVLDGGAIPHTALARRACLDAERGAASPPEAELVDGLLRYGVPFHCNVEVWLNGQFLGVADVWLVGTGVGGEVDSREHHAARDKLDETLVRHSRFEHAGLSLCHVTPTRYRAAPHVFHQALFDEVARRERLGLREPEGLVLKPRGPLLQGNPRTAPPYRLPPPR